MPLFFTSFRFALAGRGRPNVRAAVLLPSWGISRPHWFLVLFVLLMGVFYLIEMNVVTMRGYELQRLEAKQREFLETKTALTTEVTALRTLPTVQERINTRSFVKAEKGTYLATRSSSVAER